MKSVLLLSLAFLTACAMDADESSVVGWSRNSQTIIAGEKASAESLVGQAAVYLRLPEGHSCSGVLLNDHVVLTAAHCTSRISKKYGAFAYLAEPRDKSCAASAVTQFVVAPKLSAQHKEAPDLALLKLKDAICTNSTTILMPSPVANDVVRAAGFGEGSSVGLPDYFSFSILNSERNSLKELFFKDTNNEISVQNAWNELDPYLELYYETILLGLAVNPQQSLCAGDSGGPVYREENGALEIYGVNTGGLPHPTKGISSCYSTYLQMITPVGPSIPWIKSVLQTW